MIDIESSRIGIKIYVAVRRWLERDGHRFHEIVEEMCMTDDEWREIIKQVSALLEGNVSKL